MNFKITADGETKTKNPNRVEQGKRLALLSQEAKLKKKEEKEGKMRDEVEKKMRDESLNSIFGTVCVLGGVGALVLIYWQMKGKGGVQEEKKEREEKKEEKVYEEKKEEEVVKKVKKVYPSTLESFD